MKLNQGAFISKDKCLACKLFSAPLFFLFGGFYTHKNAKMFPGSPTGIKVFFVAVPAVLYLGGMINTYQAYNIFTEYREKEELWKMMEKEGAFQGKDDEEQVQLFNQVQEIIKESNKKKTDQQNEISN